MRLGNDLFFAEIERLLGEGSEVRCHIHGFSMRPLLRNGRDTVVVAPRGEAPLRVLDIVLFRYRGRHVLHRIVRIEGDRLTLAGDGNYRIREQCSAADVAGVVRRVVRPSGREIDCASRAWRRMSRCWLLLPPLVRRGILGVLARL